MTRKQKMPLIHIYIFCTTYFFRENRRKSNRSYFSRSNLSKIGQHNIKLNITRAPKFKNYSFLLCSYQNYYHCLFLYVPRKAIMFERKLVFSDSLRETLDLSLFNAM